MVTNSRNKLFDSMKTSNGRVPKAQKPATPKYESETMTKTEKGAKTHKTTGTAVLDLFSRGAAMRSQPESTYLALVKNAWTENIPLTAACVFWIRDIKKGQGERELFRKSLTWLAQNYPEKASKLIAFVPEFGRWDDLIAFRNTVLHKQALAFWADQLLKDAAALKKAERDKTKAPSISLAAKWAFSERAGKASKRYAAELRQAMKLSARGYRKLLTYLRKHLKLVESQMCAQKWGNINYEAVPSRASMLYRKAFKKHDAARYKEFLDSVKKGTAKIHAGTIAPYELASRILDLQKKTRANGYGLKSWLYNFVKTDATLEAQWNALPNYFKRPINGIVMVDTSGSMDSKIVGSNVAYVDVAVSLGVYAAERNPSKVWKNKFMTFGSKPQLLAVKGETLAEKLISVYNSDVGGTTDLQAAFDLILQTAVKNNLQQSDLPETIFIVSDMQFDRATGNGYGSMTNLDAITRKFRKAGYERPNIAFWNVAGRVMESPAKFDEHGVALYSGLSPTIFGSILRGAMNPVDAMLEVLENERYAAIVKAMEA